jgi:hypothetical protein
MVKSQGGKSECCKLPPHQTSKVMMKRIISAALLSVLSTGMLMAQGTPAPVQGTPATTQPTDTTKVKVADDQTKVKTEEGKVKADKKARKVKVKKEATTPAPQK